MFADHFQNQLGERVGWRSQLRPRGEALDLDIELNLESREERQYLVKRGNPRPGQKSLSGKARILQRAAVVRFHFGEGKIPNRGARTRSPANLRINIRIVGDDYDVIFGNGDVHLQVVGAGLDGVFKSTDGVFRQQGASASVPMHQDSPRWGCYGMVPSSGSTSDCANGCGVSGA